MTAQQPSPECVSVHHALTTTGVTSYSICHVTKNEVIIRRMSHPSE